MNYLQKKKLAFMSIVNRVKGFVRTVSGVPPLTLEKCVDDSSLIGCKVYGNSVQNGTPSPDNPIKVESVGDRTAQLFNLPTSGEISWYANASGLAPKGVRNPDGSITFDGTNGDDVVKNMQKIFGDSEKMIIEETGVYAFSCKNASSAIYMTCRLPNGSGGFAYQAIATSSRVVYETIEQGTEITVYIQVGKNASVSNLTLYPMMQKVNVEGDAVSDFEPYGYKVPVEVMGKNLLDITTAEDKNVQGVSFTIDYDTQRIKAKGIGNNNGGRLFYLTQITLSSGTYYFSSNTEAPRAALTNISTTSDVVWDNRVFTLTETTTLGLGFNITAGTEYDSEILLQIEEGATSTPYEPYQEPIHSTIYLKEPLRKIGDYADELDVNAEKVTRNIKFINTEADGWSSYNDGSGGVYAVKAYSLPEDTITNNHGIHCMCERFVGITRQSMYNTGNQGICANSRTARLCYIGITDMGIEDFRVWVSENPISLCYVLAEPTEESITLSDEIKALKGNCTLKVLTELPPSNVEVTYYSSQKGV